jgi:hypothetical protein
MNTEQRMDIEDSLTADDVLIVSEGVGDGLTTPRLRRTPPTEGNCPALRFPESGREAL